MSLFRRSKTGILVILPTTLCLSGILIGCPVSKPVLPAVSTAFITLTVSNCHTYFEKVAEKGTKILNLLRRDSRQQIDSSKMF